jgi:hypothetical protein
VRKYSLYLLSFLFFGLGSGVGRYASAQAPSAVPSCPQLILNAVDSDLPLTAGDYLLREHSGLSIHEVLVVTETDEGEGFVRRQYRREVRFGPKSGLIRGQKPRGREWHFKVIAPLVRFALKEYRRRGWPPGFIEKLWESSWYYLNDTIYSEVLHGPQRQRVATMRFVVAPFSLSRGERMPVGSTVREFYGLDAPRFREPEEVQPDTELPIPPRCLPVSEFLRIQFVPRTFHDEGLEIEPGANAILHGIPADVHLKAQALQWVQYLEVAFPSRVIPPIPTAPYRADEPLIVVFKNSMDDWFALLGIIANPQLREDIRSGGVIVEGFETSIIANAVRTLFKVSGLENVPVVEGYRYQSDAEVDFPNFRLEKFMSSEGVTIAAFKDLPVVPLTETTSVGQFLLRGATSARARGKKLNLVSFGHALDFFRFRKAQPEFDAVWGKIILMAGGQPPKGQSDDGKSPFLMPTRNWLPHQSEIFEGVDSVSRLPGTFVGVVSSHAFGGNLPVIRSKPADVSSATSPSDSVYLSLAERESQHPIFAALMAHWENTTRAVLHMGKPPGSPFDSKASVNQLFVSPLALEVLDHYDALVTAESEVLGEARSLSRVMLSESARGLDSNSLFWFRRDPRLTLEAEVQKFGHLLGAFHVSNAAEQFDETVRHRGILSKEAGTQFEKMAQGALAPDLLRLYGLSFMTYGDAQSIQLNLPLGYEFPVSYYRDGALVIRSANGPPPVVHAEGVDWHPFVQSPQNVLRTAKTVAASRHRNGNPGEFFASRIIASQSEDDKWGSKAIPAVRPLFLSILYGSESEFRRALNGLVDLSALPHRHRLAAFSSRGDFALVDKAVESISELRTSYQELKALILQAIPDSNAMVAMRLSELAKRIAHSSFDAVPLNAREILVEVVPLLLICPHAAVRDFTLHWVAQKYQVPGVMYNLGEFWIGFDGEEELDLIEERAEEKWRAAVQVQQSMPLPYEAIEKVASLLSLDEQDHDEVSAMLFLQSKGNADAVRALLILSAVHAHRNTPAGKIE